MNRSHETLARRKALGLIIWLVVGIIAGLAARRLVPGPDPVAVTIILGMAGASLGGFTFAVVGGTGATDFNLWSVPVATAGAVGLLYLYGSIARRGA